MESVLVSNHNNVLYSTKARYEIRTEGRVVVHSRHKSVLYPKEKEVSWTNIYSLVTPITFNENSTNDQSEYQILL